MSYTILLLFVGLSRRGDPGRVHIKVSLILSNINDTCMYIASGWATAVPVTLPVLC